MHRLYFDIKTQFNEVLSGACLCLSLGVPGVADVENPLGAVDRAVGTVSYFRHSVMQYDCQGCVSETSTGHDKMGEATIARSR